MSESGFLVRMADDFRGPLVRYARRLLGDVDLSADCVAETFLRFHQEIERKGPPEQPRAWLYRTVRNRAIDLLRQPRVGSLSELESAVDLKNNPATLAQEKEEQAMVMNQICRLPERQQEVVRLKFQEGLSYKEIGQVTGDSVATVGWLLHEAIAGLRTSLKSLEGGRS